MKLSDYLVAGSLSALIVISFSQTSMAQTQAQTTADPAAPQAQPAQPPLQIKPDQKVANVNGSDIKMAEIVDSFNKLPQQIRQNGLPALYPQLLERAIADRLVIAEGRKAGLAKDPQVQKRVAELESEIIREAHLSRYVESKLPKAEIEKAYQEWLKTNPAKEELRARHILVKTREEAEVILKSLRAGEDFAALAKKSSIDPSAQRGGDLGWFRPEQMVPEFSGAITKLKVGDISDIIQSKFGFHIAQVQDRRQGQQPSMTEFQRAYVQQKGSEIAERYMVGLIKGAKVDRLGLDGKPMAAPPLPANQ